MKEGIIVVILEEWPEPVPIKHTLRPVPSLPLSIIPGPYQEWIEDTCHRMQCPLDFVAVASIVMTGSIIGAGCGIKPKRLDDWIVIPNLWGGAIARPSVLLKTPALEQALSPLRLLEKSAKDAYDAEADIYDAELAAYKAKRDALQNDMKKAYGGKGELSDFEDAKESFKSLEKPETPTWKRYKTNDATIEKMAVLLSENPRGILLYRDELVGLLSAWEKEGNETNRAFYLEAWNGYGTFTADRIGRGTIYTEKCVFPSLGVSSPLNYLNI